MVFVYMLYYQSCRVASICNQIFRVYARSVEYYEFTKPHDLFAGFRQQRMI
eukprot:COSAG05_NODE_12008_length_487_cov_0.775773_1_plen_50_part_01